MKNTIVITLRIIITLLLVAPVVLIALEHALMGPVNSTQAELVRAWETEANTGDGRLRFSFKIQENGTVEGKVGKVAMQEAHLMRNRHWFSKLLGQRRDYAYCALGLVWFIAGVGLEEGMPLALNIAIGGASGGDGFRALKLASPRVTDSPHQSPNPGRKDVFHPQILLKNPQTSSEPEFRAFRKRLLTGGLILCIIGFPVGLVLKLPYVWGLAIVGIIVASVKLAMLKQ